MSQHYDIEKLQKQQLRAVKVNKHNGKQFYRVPVRILFNNSVACRTEKVMVVHVIARNATEAANHVAGEFGHRPETEVYAYGPRGGEIYRYVGYHSAMANMLSTDRTSGRPNSLKLGGF